MATKYLTYDEMMKLALKNYDKGGDGFVECWDEQMFDDYVRDFGPFTKSKAMKMFKQDKEQFDDIMGLY